jgi:serine phosphatase RsbU (regulator of sigma subunit)
MNKTLVDLASRYWPEIKAQSVEDRSFWLSDVYGLIYSAPLAILGLVWLIAATRPPTNPGQWVIFLLSFLLVYIFRQLNFFGSTEIKTGLYADWGSSLDAIATWAAALLVGPVGLWPGIVLSFLTLIWRWPKYILTKTRLNRARHLSLELADQSLLALITLTVYRVWGGIIPLPGLEPVNFFPALYAAFIWYVLSRLVWLPYFFLEFINPALAQTPEDRSWVLRMALRLYAITELLPACIAPFAVLTAGLYEQAGLWAYAFTMVGLVMIALLAHLLSQTAERSYQRSRELERLEALATEIIDAPLDASTLPELLHGYVPGMFPDSQVEIRIFPDHILLPNAPNWSPVPERAWEWMQAQKSPKAIYAVRGSPLPWEEQPSPISFLSAPIYSLETGELIGGICVMMRWWPSKIIQYFMPALQSLAAQVSSTLHQADVYARTIANERVVQELALAGQIQAGLLPRSLPDIPGYQVSAALEPTRETSGDFYDWIPLDGGKFGILVADVAEKGMGAALYMTLSRTLIRSLAMEHVSQPELVMKSVNTRLLADAASDLFVTVFYAVLDPASGTLDYCNAGQNPPIHIHNCTTRSLGRTGMGLGVEEDTTWKQATTIMERGDVLLLYTDGIVDAQNPEGEFFEERQLIEIACANAGRTAREIQETILNRVHTFAGDTPIFDDMTLMVLSRDAD